MSMEQTLSEGQKTPESASSSQSTSDNQTPFLLQQQELQIPQTSNMHNQQQAMRVEQTQSQNLESPLNNQLIACNQTPLSSSTDTAIKILNNIASCVMHKQQKGVINFNTCINVTKYSNGDSDSDLLDDGNGKCWLPHKKLVMMGTLDIDDEWKFLASELDMDSAIEKAEQMSRNKKTSPTVEMLKLWMQKQGNRTPETSRKLLIDKLTKMDRMDIVDQLEDVSG